MANVRAAQAPARSAIGLAAVFTLGAALVVALVATPVFAQAAEAADVAGIPQHQPSLVPAPVTTTAPTADAVSDALPPTRWARLPRWQKVFGVGAILTGLAAVGSGAYLLWLDGQPACRPAGCVSSRYNTALTGWLLALTAYLPNAQVQSVGTMQAILWLMAGVPVAVSVGQIIILWKYTLDKDFPAIVEALERKKKGQANANAI